MIPLVGEVKELEYVKSVVVKTAEKVMEEKSFKLEYGGHHVERFRAALTADG